MIWQQDTKTSRQKQLSQTNERMMFLFPQQKTESIASCVCVCLSVSVVCCCLNEVENVGVEMKCLWCSKSFFSLLKSLGALYTQKMIQEPRVTFTVFLYHLVRQANELFQDVDSWKKQIYVIVWLDTTLVWRLFYIIPSNEHNFSQATLDDPRKLCTCTMKVFRLLFHCTPSFRPTLVS